MHLINFTELVFEKVKMNLRSEVRKSYLSYAWWVLEPALMVTVFYIVFGVLLRRGGPDFLVFLICGYIPFQWFARTVQNGSVSISNGAGLINQIKISKVFFPLVTIFHDFFKAIIVFVLLLVVLAIFGVKPSLSWLYIIPIIIAQFAFVTTCSVFTSMILPFARDLRFLIGTTITLVMFSSGIFYNYQKTILPKHQELFLLNPMANLLANYREVLLYSGGPDWFSLAAITIGSGLVLSLLVYILWRMDGIYPRLVNE